MRPFGAAVSREDRQQVTPAARSVEGAWAYRMRARIGRHKVDRIEALPKIVRDIGWKAQVRLCTRYRRPRARGKTANVVNVAIAREMVGLPSGPSPARFNLRSQAVWTHPATANKKETANQRSASAWVCVRAGGGTMPGSPRVH